MYGSVITMCPMTMVRNESETPTAWKSSSSEIPKTTYGITSGLSRSAETGLLPRKACRTSTIEARMPSATAPALDRAAIFALVARAFCRSEFVRNWWYQCSVNPLSGNDGSCELSNEKMSRITIGA